MQRLGLTEERGGRCPPHDRFAASGTEYLDIFSLVQVFCADLVAAQEFSFIESRIGSPDERHRAIAQTELSDAGRDCHAAIVLLWTSSGQTLAIEQGT